jgi:hypothetical protein
MQNIGWRQTNFYWLHFPSLTFSKNIFFLPPLRFITWFESPQVMECTHVRRYATFFDQFKNWGELAFLRDEIVFLLRSKISNVVGCWTESRIINAIWIFRYTFHKRKERMYWIRLFYLINWKQLEAVSRLAHLSISPNLNWSKLCKGEWKYR